MTATEATKQTELNSETTGRLLGSAVGVSASLIGICLCLNQMLQTDGIVLADELVHFLHSEAAWYEPNLWFGSWTRPGRNLIHGIAAPFGFTASRLFTIGLTTLGAYFTYLTAKKLRIQSAWAVPILFWFQPWVIEYGYGVLTQSPFLLVWIAAVFCDISGRRKLAGFLFGYVSLIRHEGIALSFGYIALCVLRRQLTPAVFVAAAPALVNLAAYLVGAGLPLRVYFDSKPTEIYGSGPLWHFVLPTLLSIGLIPGVLTAISTHRLIGVVSSNAVLVSYPAYFLLHSLIFWRGLYASGGYVAFLMPMAPFFAIAAALGLDTCQQWAHRAHTSEIRQLNKYVLRTTGALVVVVTLIQAYCLPHRLIGINSRPTFPETSAEVWSAIRRGMPLFKDPVLIGLKEAVRGLPDDDSVVVCHHPYYFLVTDTVWLWPERKIQSADLSDLSEGTLFIWDRMTGTFENTDPQSLSMSGWRVENEFEQGDVAILRRVSRSRPDDPVNSSLSTTKETRSLPDS